MRLRTKLVWIAMSLLSSQVLAAPGGAPDVLSRFVREDGALPITAGGDFVDPYFAQKALLVAWEAGLKPVELTHNWLSWVIPRQRKDGGFDRFCLKPQGWHACKPADADDSSVATFLQLIALYEKHRAAFNAPELPLRTASAKLNARTLLDSLRTNHGIYKVFLDKPIAYLMDNTEVHASLMQTGHTQQAKLLQLAITKQFYQNSQWLPANSSFDRVEFYPHALAPTYRWHTGLSSQSVIDREFAEWSRQWGNSWLRRSQDQYPWGLVAWGARGIQAQHWIRCWRFMHIQHDKERGWTVLDEAVDQSLKHIGVEPISASCNAVLGVK